LKVEHFKVFKPCAKVQSHNLPEGTTVVEAIFALTDAKIEGTEQKHLEES